MLFDIEFIWFDWYRSISKLQISRSRSILISFRFRIKVDRIYSMSWKHYLASVSLLAPPVIEACPYLDSAAMIAMLISSFCVLTVVLNSRLTFCPVGSFWWWLGLKGMLCTVLPTKIPLTTTSYIDMFFFNKKHRYKSPFPSLADINFKMSRHRDHMGSIGRICRSIGPWGTYLYNNT